jgi:hypothetical protein
METQVSKIKGRHLTQPRYAGYPVGTMSATCTRTSKSVAVVVVAAKRAARRDGVRVFRHFARLEADSVKVALSCPTHAARRVPLIP